MSSHEYDSSAKLQKPRVSRHGKHLHISYECPHRLNVSKLYPVQSRRGAEIIVSGYDDGLHILWRGGKPLHVASRTVKERVSDLSGTRSVHTEWNQAVSIRTRTNGRPTVTEEMHKDDRPYFEGEDDEFDEDEPYPSITQELKLSFGSPVLRLAVPNMPAASSLESRVRVPLMVKERMLLTAACADGSLRVVVLPLTPPSAAAKSKGRLGAQICELNPPTSSFALARDVALTWTAKSSLPSPDDQMDVDRPQSEGEDLDLLVASSVSGHSETLNFYRIPIAFDETTGGKIPDTVDAFLSLPLSAASHCLHFTTSQYPSTQHSRLLLADLKGLLKVYDPFASKSRPSSRGSGAEGSSESGACISTFATPFQMPKSATTNCPGLAQRRKIVDAAWVSGARAVMVLLEGGQWGVWDIDGASHPQSKPTTPNTFAISGFIGSADAPAPSESKNRSTQGLAPSTPNTRQQRQETLFGAPKPPPATTASRGGISAVATTGTHGTVDDSLVLWHSNEAYHIPSLATLWQRSLNSSGRDIGSLYGPGLSRIDGIDLCGEILNGVTQFPVRSSTSNFGTVNQRDFIVTGEYRLVIVMSTRPQTPAKGLFAQAASTSAALDQQLLERGELGLGGMDRLLDGMDRPNGFAAKKRVGFAAY